MDPHVREKVAKFLVDTKPINGGWTETRTVFKWGENLFLIEDNFPHWTKSQILTFLKETNTQYFEIEVKVVPEA